MANDKKISFIHNLNRFSNNSMCCITAGWYSLVQSIIRKKQIVSASV